jgi:hypothetical protein
MSFKPSTFAVPSITESDLGIEIRNLAEIIGSIPLLVYPHPSPPYIPLAYFIPRVYIFE